VSKENIFNCKMHFTSITLTKLKNLTNYFRNLFTVGANFLRPDAIPVTN